MAWTVGKPLGASIAPATLLSRIAWAILLATPWFLLPAFGRDQPAQRAQQDEIAVPFSASDQTNIKKAVEAVLPAPWVITKTKLGSTPSDWYCDDPRGGFVVECSNGQETCRIWFLPLDWIGIRQVPNKAARTCYWEGVLAGSRYKTITHIHNDRLQEVMQKLFDGMSTPSLVNSGYSRAMDIFAHRMEATDAAAQRLIKEHCTTPEEFEEAAHSLIVLGVPARTVFIRAAREVESYGRDLFCGALGLMGGDEAIGVLCDVLANPKVSDHERSYAAMDLRQHTDKRIGPALHKALKEMSPGNEPMDIVIRELGHRHYEPAISDLLSLLRNGDMRCQWPASQALATLRCKEAIPDLRKIVERNPLKKGEPPRADSCQMALLRLTGDWGHAGEESRYMIWLPEEATVGQPIQATVYTENIAAGPVEWNYISLVRDDLMVNGKPLVEPTKDRFSVSDFMSGLVPHGEVRSDSIDLSKDLMKPGRYTVRFGLGEIHSNEAVILVKPARP